MLGVFAEFERAMIQERVRAGLLPEPLLTHLFRSIRKYHHPVLWMALGSGIVIVGFSFLDRYAPGFGLIWNAINGKIGGMPYRYVLTLGTFLFLFGGYLWARR